eukprot:4531667-Pyramimonas_sp.AAC.1
MKVALTAAGVDTSSCFEREQLEARFYELSVEAQQSVKSESGRGAERDEPRKQAGHANSNTSGAQASDSSASSSETSSSRASSVSWQNWADTVKTALS